MTTIGYVRYETRNKLSIQAVLHGIFNSWPLASCSWPIRCPNTIYQCYSNLLLAYNCNYTERTRTIRYCKYECLLSGCWSYFRQLTIVTSNFVVASHYLTQLDNRGESVYSNKEIVSWYTLYKCFLYVLTHLNNFTCAVIVSRF